jgi:hypothetical protein
MAPLTWKNVTTPDLSGELGAIADATKSLTEAGKDIVSNLDPTERQEQAIEIEGSRQVREASQRIKDAADLGDMRTVADEYSTENLALNNFLTKEQKEGLTALGESNLDKAKDVASENALLLANEEADKTQDANKARRVYYDSLIGSGLTVPEAESLVDNWDKSKVRQTEFEENRRLRTEDLFRSRRGEITDKASADAILDAAGKLTDASDVNMSELSNLIYGELGAVREEKEILKEEATVRANQTIANALRNNEDREESIEAALAANPEADVDQVVSQAMVNENRYNTASDTEKDNASRLQREANYVNDLAFADLESTRADLQATYDATDTIDPAIKEELEGFRKSGLPGENSGVAVIKKDIQKGLNPLGTERAVDDQIAKLREVKDKNGERAYTAGEIDAVIYQSYLETKRKGWVGDKLDEEFGLAVQDHIRDLDARKELNARIRTIDTQLNKLRIEALYEADRQVDNYSARARRAGNKEQAYTPYNRSYITSKVKEYTEELDKLKGELENNKAKSDAKETATIAAAKEAIRKSPLPPRGGQFEDSDYYKRLSGNMAEYGKTLRRDLTEEEMPVN